MNRLEQLSIYLLKPSILDPSDAIRDDADFTEVELPADVPEGSVLLARSTAPRAPHWARYFPPETRLELQGLRTASAGAVLLIPAAGRWFALCFGTGWHLLRKDAFVRSFGMRTALSVVKPDTLKSADISTFDNFAKHRKVSTSKGTTIDSFDIEGMLELLRGVVGECQYGALARHVGGKDSCVLWTRVEFKRFPKLCALLLKVYEMDRVSQRYPILDNVSEVRDPADLHRLDTLLDAKLADPAVLSIGVAPPEAVDWESIEALTLSHSQAPAPAMAYTISQMRQMVAPSALTSADTRGIEVGTRTPAGVQGRQSWTVYDCLVAEVDDPNFPGVKFILMAGSWYEVAASFVQQTNNALATVAIHQNQLPNALQGEKEGAYNARFAAGDPQNLFLLDKKNIPYGGGRSRIEVCDVLGSGAVFYHLKDYSGSATLSHLFSQGTVSCRLLHEQDFRQMIIDRYPNIPPSALQVNTFTASGLEVVYGIICEANRAIPAGLPFFAKVRLMESVRELRSMGYTNVSVAKISR